MSETSVMIEIAAVGTKRTAMLGVTNWPLCAISWQIGQFAGSPFAGNLSGW